MTETHLAKETRRSARLIYPYWRRVLREAYRASRDNVREHLGWGVASVVLVPLAAVIAVRFFGSEGAWFDDAIAVAVGLATVILAFVVLFIVHLIAIPPRMHEQSLLDLQKVEDEVGHLNGEIRRLTQPPAATLMPLRELSLHLNGRVRQFAEIDEWEMRSVAIDSAVRDALSLGELQASGRDIDWIDKLASFQTSRTWIGTDFWNKRGDIDWNTVGHDDPHERAIAILEGEEQFYDLAFNRSDVARLWPDDFHEPLNVLRLGELAAESLGYDFHSGRSHTLSLIAGIRESAAQGKLELTGRADCFGRSQKSDYFYPLVPIAKEHFRSYWINIPGLFVLTSNPSNWDVHTYQPGNDQWKQEAYLDLHFSDRRQALDWLLSFRPKRLQPDKEPIE